MASYKELLAQRQALETQINEARKRETKEAIAQVKSLVADFGFTAEDIFGPARKAPLAQKIAKAGPKTRPGATKSAPKYRNPETNETWTGKGRAPRWLHGRDKADFLIKP